jgi:sporulation protein YlmC with PRC-barrel domain
MPDPPRGRRASKLLREPVPTLKETTMLWRASTLRGYEIQATDGRIGSVSDLLFDDTDWTVRWLVIDTGDWLPDRKVLLPPSAVDEPDPANRVVPVALTRERVEQSPSIETDAPVSRQMETDLYGHYGWAPYWYGAYGAPMDLAAGAVIPPAVQRGADGDVGAPREEHGDPHLRSAHEVTGYYVRATDDDIGHIEEFLIEPESWTVRYLVIDTRNWWPGKMVLISPKWIRDVSWNDRQVRVDLTRAQVKDGPEFDPSTTVDRAYEERLHSHYGYLPYWGL